MTSECPEGVTHWWTVADATFTRDRSGLWHIPGGCGARGEHDHVMDALTHAPVWTEPTCNVCRVAFTTRILHTVVSL